MLKNKITGWEKQELEKIELINEKTKEIWEEIGLKDRIHSTYAEILEIASPDDPNLGARRVIELKQNNEKNKKYNEIIDEIYDTFGNLTNDTDAASIADIIFTNLYNFREEIYETMVTISETHKEESLDKVFCRAITWLKEEEIIDNAYFLIDKWKR